MFDFIRNHRRWMQFILLLLIIPAFAFFGIEGYVGFMSRDKTLAEVDGSAITQPEYDFARREQLDQMRSMLGSQFDAQALDTPAFRERVLNDLISQRVIATAAMNGRYSVSDELLRDTIASIPTLQENGVFSPERYRMVLAGQGMKPADFEAGLRRDLILAQVLSPIGATASATNWTANRLMAALTEQRTVAVRRFLATAYEADVSVSDAEVKDWYEKNTERLRVPDSVDIEYVLVDEAAATEGVNVSDDEIVRFYQQNQSRYGQPERRRVRHILLEVAPGADQAAQDSAAVKARELSDRLKADPTEFAALAKAFSEDPGSANDGGDLGWISKDTLVPEVEKAVFSLNKDQISDVIQSPFGFHVITVTDVQPASVKPLEQVKDDVATEVRRQMAAARFATLAGQLTDRVYDQRDAMAPVATELGLPLRKAEGLAREGLLPDNLVSRSEPVAQDQFEVLNNPRLRQIAFSQDVLLDRNNSGVIELAPDKIVSLRVSNVRSAAIPPLEQVSSLIQEVLLREKSLALAREAGQAVLKAGSAPGAELIGFAPAEVVSRQDSRDLAQYEISAVMNQPSQTVPMLLGLDTVDGYALFDIKAVSSGEALTAQEQQEFKGQLAQALGRAEEQAALALLRQLYNVKILPDAQVLIQAESGY